MATVTTKTKVTKSATRLKAGAGKTARALAAGKKSDTLKHAEAHIRYIHMAPQKVERIASLVRGLSVAQAGSLLLTLPKRACVPIDKAIKSASANAIHNYDMDPKLTWIESIRVGQSMELPRMMPRAQGRAYRIRKRFCHIDVVLVERAASKTDKSAKQIKSASKAVGSAKTAAKETKAAQAPAEAKSPSVIRETKMK
jgi:large subunit ribosomal protein L22